MGAVSGSKIAVSPAIWETSGQLALAHRDGLSHHDAAFLTNGSDAEAEQALESLAAKRDKVVAHLMVQLGRTQKGMSDLQAYTTKTKDAMETAMGDMSHDLTFAESRALTADLRVEMIVAEGVCTVKKACSRGGPRCSP